MVVGPPLLSLATIIASVCLMPTGEANGSLYPFLASVLTQRLGIDWSRHRLHLRKNPLGEQSEASFGLVPRHTPVNPNPPMRCGLGISPNPPMGCVEAGQAGMRELQGRWRGLHGGGVTRQRVFSSRAGPGERSGYAGNRLIVRLEVTGCARGAGGREFGGVGSVADSAVRQGVVRSGAVSGRD